MKSLQGRMLWVVGATIALCWIGALGVLMIYFANSQTSIWDDQLEAMATKILRATSTQKALRPTPPETPLGTPPEGQPPELALPDTALAHGGELAFQIWTDRSKLLVHTPGASAAPLKPDFVEGFTSRVIDGQRWRVYSVSDSTGKVVQAGNLHSVIDRELQKEAFIALLLGTLLLALAGAGMGWAVRRSLKPVVELQAVLRRRTPFDLTPLPFESLPTELRPLVDAFNHLLRQLADAVGNERRFVDDAAHELRTPLSALQAQAQVALAATSLADKDAALVKLLAVAWRSTRLSEQLLDLARLSAGQRASQRSVVDLGVLALHVVNEFEVQAQQAHRSLVLETDPCQIVCDIDEVGVLLRNLVDNALRFTAEGGRVRVRTGMLALPSQGGSRAFVEVADDGPGVPPGEHEAVFKRFHRVEGTGTRGSGIGLSLVAGIAQLHEAQIETGPGLDETGFSVRVIFPATPVRPDFAAVQAHPSTVAIHRIASA